MIILLFSHQGFSPLQLTDFLLSKLNFFNFLLPQIEHLIKQRQVFIKQQIVTNLQTLIDSPTLVKVVVDQFPPPPPAWQMIIHYIDFDLLVVEKPAGIVTQLDQHHTQLTLEQQVAPYVNFPAKTLHPGIVHRLDKVTTGLLLIARNLTIAHKLRQSIKQRTVQRHYLALVNGRKLPAQFVVKAPLLKTGFQRHIKVAGAGKPAQTNFSLIQQFRNFALIKCQLVTGRTHQIRVHLQHIKHPVINDPLYNRTARPGKFIYLHAYRIKFKHPTYSQKFGEFTTFLPVHFISFIKNHI